ncbi:MAG: hypothetical protein RL148_228 [Planctomycetota bacterium]
MQASKNLQIVGVTDEISTCDCCGRNDLKRAVALKNADGAVVYFGTSCAAQALNWTDKAVTVAAKKAHAEALEAAAAARRAKDDLEFAAWRRWLVARTGGTEVGAMIAQLGGFAAARAAYAAGGAS